MMVIDYGVDRVSFDHAKSGNYKREITKLRTFKRDAYSEVR